MTGGATKKNTLGGGEEDSNPARGQFFAMLISCSRYSNGSMCLPFW